MSRLIMMLTRLFASNRLNAMLSATYYIGRRCEELKELVGVAIRNGLPLSPSDVGVRFDRFGGVRLQVRFRVHNREIDPLCIEICVDDHRDRGAGTAIRAWLEAQHAGNLSFMSTSVGFVATVAGVTPALAVEYVRKTTLTPTH